MATPSDQLPPWEEAAQAQVPAAGPPPSDDYDFAAAKAAGVQQGANGHWPDTFKKPNHITFSTDSQYSKPGQEGGTWSQVGGTWHYAPSEFVLSQHSPEELQTYFAQREKGSVLDLPQTSNEVPPWEQSPVAAPQGQVPGAVPQDRPELATGPMPDPGAMDQASQVDKNASFLKRWFDASAQGASQVLLNPAGARHSLDQLSRGTVNTVLGAFKAPGQALESVKALDPNKDSFIWNLPPLSTYIGASHLIGQFQKEFIDDPRKDIPFEDQLAQGGGSALAFMATGGMLNAAGFSPALAAASTGAAVGASQQYDEAVNMGATPEQAALAYLGGAAFGSTEAIPGALFLKKLNAITGGKLVGQLKNFGQSMEHSTAWEAVKGGLEEAVQEGIQQVGQNWVAKDLAGYDPSRELGENFWTNVATGGIVGSMLGGGINMLRNAEKTRILKEMTDEYQAKKTDPINDIGGPFTPVQDLVMLKQLGADADAEYQRRVQEAILAQAQSSGFSSVIEASYQGPNYLGDRAAQPTSYSRFWMDQPVSKSVEKILPKLEPGETWTVAKALEHTPVVVQDANPYAELISIGEQNVAKLQARLAAGDQKAQMPLKILQNQVTNLKEKAKITVKLAEHVRAYAAAFRQVYNSDMKLVITAANPTLGVSNSSGMPPAGFFSMTNDVEIGGKPTQVGYLFIKMDHLATETLNNKHMAVSDPMKQARRNLFETINHELGHAIATSALRNIYDTIASVESTDQQKEGARGLLALMSNEYENWLTTAAGKNQDFLITSQMALMRGLNLAMNSPEAHKMPMTAAFPTKDLVNGDGTITQKQVWPNKNYLLSFDEFFAEMTARLATQGALANPVMTKYFSSVLPQYQALFAKMPSFAQAEYANDWKTYLTKTRTEYHLKEELEKVQAGGSGDLIKAIRKGIPGFDANNFAGLQQHLDRFDKLISYGFNLLQLAKENPHIEGLQSYVKSMAAWAEYQRNFQADANEVYKSWRNLGKLEAAQLSAVLFDEALSRKLTDPATLTKLLSAEAQSVYSQIREQLAKVLEEMRAASLLDLHRSILDNEELLNTEVQQVNEDFDKMGREGYFPFIRFGKFTITARAKEALDFNGNTYKQGELISFPAFETERERNEVLADLRTQLGAKATVASSIMRETDFVIQGMPRSLLRALRNKLEATGDLTVEQAHAFEAAAAESAPFRNFQKHMLKKKGVHGYSEDALRSFASYIRGAAGHIARVKFNDDIRSAIDLVQQSTEVIKELGGRADERQEIRHWLDRHFSYVMNPGNELAALRGVGFVYYLGFNIKSAVVNLTQLVTTVGPYLSARYGDKAALAEMSKATWTLKDWVSKRKDYLSAMDKLDKGQVNQAETRKALLGRMIARGHHEGWLDQSLATELAIAASQNNLDRGAYLPKARRFWHEVSRWSALPFHLVEKLNRYVTAISAFNLELQRSGGNFERSVLAAREANWSANYENARWNRPEFMRGKKSSLFLFGNYLQNTLYFATKDPGALRYWLMMLTLAGLTGLPGADNVADLADFAGTYLNRLLGLKNPKTQIRVELRERLEELGANPDLILHGLAQDSFGLGHVGELTGIPVPHLDVSRSVGMGDIIPGTQLPGMTLQAAPNDILVAAAGELSGAGGSLVEEYYKAAMSTDPDMWKRAEKLAPLVAARNASKATRMAMRGGETTSSGNVVAEFDPYDPRTALELIGQGLGFQPSKLSQGWERQIAVADQIQYYKVQQEGLLRQHNFALWQQDREAAADVREAIRKYNQIVPEPEMGISGPALRQSFKSFLEKRVVSGMGLEAEKKYRRLREQTEQAYPNPMGKEGTGLSDGP